MLEGSEVGLRDLMCQIFVVADLLENEGELSEARKEAVRLRQALAGGGMVYGKGHHTSW